MELSEILAYENSNEATTLNQVFSVLKYLFILVWVGVGVFVLWPQFSSVFDLELDTIASSEEDLRGLILEPMRPVSERSNISSVITYPTTSAEGLGGYYISGSITTKDLRVVALQRYLRAKGSPMATYADHIVRISDTSGINYKTFVSISGVESGFGKVGHAARVGHNPIGWRGGPGGKFNIFSSWTESINYLIPRLARNYGSDPNPFAVQGTYCPPCAAVGTNEWANGVTKNLNDIEAVYSAL